MPNEDQDFEQQHQQIGLVSLPPTIDQLMEPFSFKKNLHKVRIKNENR
jgi:hypothetical protein